MEQHHFTEIKEFNINTIRLFDNTLAEYHISKTDSYDTINLIGLFVTGSWCQPCKEFEAKLIQKYNQINKPDRKVFEVIHMASEKNDTDFKNAIKHLPWPIIKFNDPKIEIIAKEFNIENIPMLIIINKDCKKVISFRGREDIIDHEDNVYDYWYDELNKEIEE